MFITQLTSVFFLWPLEISMVHMKNINENVINLKLNVLATCFFFHFLFITKMTFFICFRESRKVVEWPRFAPFHCQIKKSSGGASPPEPPLQQVRLAALGFSTRCARQHLSPTDKIYRFCIQICRFSESDLQVANFKVGKSVNVVPVHVLVTRGQTTLRYNINTIFTIQYFYLVK